MPCPPPKKKGLGNNDGPGGCVEEGLSYALFFFNDKGFDSNEELFLCRGHPVDEAWLPSRVRCECPMDDGRPQETLIVITRMYVHRRD